MSGYSDKNFLRQLNEAFQGEPAALDIITTSPDELNRQALEFHKLVRAKLEVELAVMRQRLESAAPSDITAVATAQAGIAKLKWVLELPEQVFNEEKGKANGR